jgi:hypothetical protein
MKGIDVLELTEETVIKTRHACTMEMLSTVSTGKYG